MSKTMKTQGIGRPGILAVRATREVQGTDGSNPGTRKRVKHRSKQCPDREDHGTGSKPSSGPARQEPESQDVRETDRRFD